MLGAQVEVDMTGGVYSGSDPEWDELTRRPHVEVIEALFRYADSLRPLGLRDPAAQLLGRGAFGVAYKTRLGGKDSVLKLTRDPHEVLASYQLVGKRHRHVVPIHGVWSLAQTHVYDFWAPWFLIHRGYLDPLGKVDAEICDFLFYAFISDDHDLSPIPLRGGDRIRAEWKEIISTGWVDIDRRGKHRDVKGYEGQRATRAMQMMVEISHGIEELRRVGIEWADCHAGNVMRDAGGLLKIADVGYGSERDKFLVEPTPLTPDLAVKYARRF